MLSVLLEHVLMEKQAWKQVQDPKSKRLVSWRAQIINGWPWAND